MKRCNVCEEDKSLDDFYTRKDGYKEYACKPCYKIKKRGWYSRTKTLPAKRFALAIHRAKSRNIDFNIKIEDYMNLVSQPCKYCKSDTSKEVGVGLDRLNNDIGYELTNVVTCCKACNFGRNEHFTPEEWQTMIDALLKHRMERWVSG